MDPNIGKQFEERGGRMNTKGKRKREQICCFGKAT